MGMQAERLAAGSELRTQLRAERAEVTEHFHATRLPDRVQAEAIRRLQGRGHRQSFDVDQRRPDRDEVPETDVRIRIVDHDASGADTEERCCRAVHSPTDAELRAHVLEVDHRASLEIRRCGAEGCDETEYAGRRAIE